MKGPSIKPFKWVAVHVSISAASSLLVVCKFASDVTAAMLVVKNKIISLPWEFNSIFI